MCTNDLYVCRDSSHINCTLACSTLGYIPCKNYMDKNVCDSVVKYSLLKANLLNSQKQKKIDLHSTGFFDYPKLNESIFIIVLGLFVLISVSIILTLFTMFYFRMKKRNKNSQQNSRILNSTELENFHNESVFYDTKEKKETKNGNNRRGSDDYQLYGEPPPSYKAAKYFPKVVQKKEHSKDALSTTHIYEDIKDLANEDATAFSNTNSISKKHLSKYESMDLVGDEEETLSSLKKAKSLQDL